MTDDDDPLDAMATPLLDDAAVTAALRGERPAGNDDWLTPVSVLTQAARAPGTLGETEISADLLDHLVAAASQRPTVPASGRRTHQLAIVAAALVLSTGGVAAAATDQLLAPLQDAVAAVVSHAGIDLPRSDDHDPTNPEDAGNGARQTPDTAPDAETTPPEPGSDNPPPATTPAPHTNPSSPVPPTTVTSCAEPGACTSSPPTAPVPTPTPPTPPATPGPSDGAPVAPPTSSPTGSPPPAPPARERSSSTPTTPPVIALPEDVAVTLPPFPSRRP